MDTTKMQKNFGIVPPDWKQDALNTIHEIKKDSYNGHS
jgi:hypothetical protein